MAVKPSFLSERTTLARLVFEINGSEGEINGSESPIIQGLFEIASYVADGEPGSRSHFVSDCAWTSCGKDGAWGTRKRSARG
jgi:hypothetical protein